MVLVRTSEPPTLLQHADTLRYLLLAVSGGIYSDIDTKRLKPISEWSRHAELWKDGKGWLSADDRKRMDAEGGLPPPSVIIGIEADVGDRSDWHDWWPRPLQIVQWTLASAPHHPIFIDALMMIQRQTAQGLSWMSERPLEIARLHAEENVEAAKKLSEATMVSDPKDGGPLGIMEWTGPGAWDD
jgi:alpha 1,6-mannosyltransferase